MSETEHQAAFIAPDPEEVATLFPAYDVHALIACGGMGAVYQATQRSLDRAVAIKILPREFSIDEAFRTGFEAEAKAMAKLNHPNLIGVYDFGEVDGMLFIVMEYVHGKSLFHSVHGRALDEGEALRIVSDVCHGLAHAHEHGILHRDIKPGNILLDENANPKIGDFGLARALESEIQEGEQIFGTPGYTAPEIIHPPFTFDHRADIFAVGVMLYELLSGNTPDKTEGLPGHLRVSNPRIDAIIRKATHPDPGSRFSSAKELASSLEKVASSHGNHLVTDSPSMAGPRPSASRASRSKSPSGGTIALILLAIGAAAILFFVESKTKKITEVLEKPDEPVKQRVIDLRDTTNGKEPVEDTEPVEDQKTVEDQTPTNEQESPNDPEPPKDPSEDLKISTPSSLLSSQPVRKSPRWSNRRHRSRSMMSPVFSIEPGAS